MSTGAHNGSLPRPTHKPNLPPSVATTQTCGMMGSGAAQTSTALPELHISEDHGTSTAALAFHIAEPGVEPCFDNVFAIFFDRKETFSPQQVAYANNGIMYWGHDVEQALANNLIAEEDIIESWKLLLYKIYRSDQISKVIYEQLKGRHVTQVIADVQKARYNFALDYIKKHRTVRPTYSPEVISHICP